MTLPCSTCAAECCFSPAVTVSEYEHLRKKYPGVRFTHLSDLGDRAVLCVGRPGMRCPFVVDNRCSIYEDRPAVCRKFGEDRELPCPKKPLPTSIFRGSPS